MMAHRPVAITKEELELILEVSAVLPGNPELRAQLQQKVAEQKSILNAPTRSTEKLLTECCGQPVTPWTMHKGGRGGPTRVAPSAMEAKKRVDGDGTADLPDGFSTGNGQHVAPQAPQQQSAPALATCASHLFPAHMQQHMSLQAPVAPAPFPPQFDFPVHPAQLASRASARAPLQSQPATPTVQQQFAPPPQPSYFRPAQPFSLASQQFQFAAAQHRVASAPQQFPSLAWQQQSAPAAAYLTSGSQPYPQAPQQFHPAPQQVVPASHLFAQAAQYSAPASQHFAPASQQHQSAPTSQQSGRAPYLAEPFTTPQHSSRRVTQPPPQPPNSSATLTEDEDEDEEMTENEYDDEDGDSHEQSAAGEYVDEVEYDDDGNTIISKQPEDEKEYEDEDEAGVDDAVKQWNANVASHMDVAGPEGTVNSTTGEHVPTLARVSMEDWVSPPAVEDRVMDEREAAQEAFDRIKAVHRQQSDDLIDVPCVAPSALLDIPSPFERAMQQQLGHYGLQQISNIDHESNARFAQQQSAKTFAPLQDTTFERAPSYSFQGEFSAVFAPQQVSVYHGHYDTSAQQDGFSAAALYVPVQAAASTFPLPDVGNDLNFDFDPNAGDDLFASDSAGIGGFPDSIVYNAPSSFTTADENGNVFAPATSAPPSWLGSAVQSNPDSSSNIVTGYSPSASAFPVSATFEDAGSFRGSVDGFTPTSSMGFSASALQSPSFQNFAAAAGPPVDVNGAYGSFYHSRGEY